MVKVDWVEVWTDLPQKGLKLRMLRGMTNGRIELRDPHRESELLGIFGEYSDAVRRLEGDGFVIIEGRIDESHDS